MTLALPRHAFALPSRWRAHLGALALAGAFILLLLSRDARDMARIWWTSSTFGHCLLIGPIVAWLVWQRRRELAQLSPAAWWPGLAVVLAGGAGWWLGEAASVGFARQSGLVLMLEGAVVTLLGPRVARGLAFPLGYALFLVPFGEWLEAPLQAVTVALIMPLLSAVGIPASADGVMIHAGRYYFEVAEACSGAKFVIAMAAFGVLVAAVGFRSWRRRAVWLAACLVVPVLANGVRAFATIWLADLTSVEAAGGFDHIVFGWVFFALVVGAMLAIAWRRFDRAPDALSFDPAALQGPVRHRAPLTLAAALVATSAAAFPAWSALVEARAAPIVGVAAPEVPGWHRVGPTRTTPWRPWYPGAALAIQRYADAGGHSVDLALAAYSRQSEGRELVGYGMGVLPADGPWLRVADEASIAGGAAIRIVAPGPARRLVVTWYRVGDSVTAQPAAVKIATLKARLLGGSPRAVALHLSVEEHPRADAGATIDAFLAAAGGPAQLMARAIH